MKVVYMNVQALEVRINGMKREIMKKYIQRKKQGQSRTERQTKRHK